LLVGLPVPYRLRFGVQFYAADPCKLFEEVTRYVNCLQTYRWYEPFSIPINLHAVKLWS